MLLVALAVVLFLSLIPVKAGAHLVGAGRDSFAACFVALVGASLIAGYAAHHVRLGSALTVFVTAFVYMLVLDTTYLRGLAIAVIQFVLSVLLVIALAATFVGPMLYRVFR